jgi:hypothetical protein
LAVAREWRPFSSGPDVVRAGREIALEAIDWATLVRPGDLVVWGQSCAEPVALAASLMESRATIGGIRVFIGISNSPNVDPKHTDHVSFSSYCGTGNNNQGLGDKLDILPIHYGKLAEALGRQAPVVLLSLARGCDADHFSYGAAGDYVGDLVNRARLVVAEVSDRAPRTGAGADLRRDQIDLVVRSSSLHRLHRGRAAHQFDLRRAHRALHARTRRQIGGRHLG